MKKILAALLLLVGLNSFSQTTGYFRYDSIRLEKVGGNSELILLNSTRDSIGFLYNMGNGRTKFRTVSSLGITPNVRNGIRKSVDTLLLGDSLDRFTPIVIRSSLINGSRYNHLLLTNRDIGAYDPYPYMSTYTPSTFGIRRVYGDQYGDVDSTFYGGSASFLTQIFRDSTLSQFGAGKRNELLAGMGLEAVGQYYPPRDSMVLKVGRDGQSGNELFAQKDIGNSWGYNINVVPESTFPLFPITNIRSSIDLSRVSDNTRRKKMVGAGVSGLTTMYKTYQTPINTATYSAGNYTENIFGLRAYGDAYPLISTATKTKTLAVWEVKNAYGVYVDPQYRYTNTVNNGYGIYAAGDTDLNVFKGFTYLGPGTTPTRLNNTEGLRYRLNVTGRGHFTDSLISDGNIAGFVVKGQGMIVSINTAVGNEATTSFLQTDSTATGSIGAYVPASRDSRGFYIRSEGFSSTGTYDNNNPGFYVQVETGANHTNITRWWRNGHMVINHSVGMNQYRLYKWLMVGGASLFNDTVTIKNIPTGGAAGDTVNYKPALFDANGNIYKGAWAYAGSGGGGGGITALTGDVTASGSGSVAATLATVNSNVGSFTNANITVNAKGLITAASNGTAGMPNVLTTAGQLIRSSSGSTPQALSVGQTDMVLQVIGGYPEWGLIIKTGASTPTISNPTNVTGTPSSITEHYTRTGAGVTVWGSLSINATTAASTTIELTPPVATTLSSAGNAAGTFTSSNGGSGIGVVIGLGTTVQFSFTPPTSGNRTIYYHYSYLIE